MITVKVRIAVAVDEDGDWNFGSDSSGSDRQAVQWATDGLFGSVKVYWIDLELPVPKSASVQAGVAPDEGEAP